MGKEALAVALAVAALFGLPAAASGENALVEAVSTDTVYTGSSLVDDVTVLLNNPPGWIFQQGGTPGAALMTAGFNCGDVHGDGTRLLCGITGGVIFNLNGGNDKVLGGVDGHGMTFNGGDGNDFISVSGAAGNIINGDADNDTILVSAAPNQNTIDGGTGNDTIEFPNGPDLVNGGPGTDTVLYETGASSSVSVSLDDLPNDGKTGSLLGNIHSDVENLTGGTEDDTFTGSAAANVLIGNAGNDTLTGDAGQDTLNGGDGTDTINARDGEHDNIDCGAGDDTAFVDPSDTLVNCEHVVFADDDHDGFTADVDCNDHDPSIHPGALDTPGDGVDQDCSGGDAPAPIIDADQDGSVPPADCNDHNAAIHPGAPDIPGNGIDENCDGQDAAFPTLTSSIVNSWLAGATTKVLQLEVQRVPAGATVKVACNGKGKATGCPFRSKRAKVTGGRAKLTPLFKHRRLKPGVKVDISITAPATIGKFVRFTMRKRKIPKMQQLCIRPGSTSPGACG